MVQNLSKLLTFSVISFLIVFSTVTIAQTTTSDWILVILQTLFGELPSPCQYAIGSSECVQCLGYVKFIPFIFFTTLFFFVFYLVIQQTLAPTVRSKGDAQELSAGRLEALHYRIATIIGIIIAIILLHVTTIEGLLNQLMLWLGLFAFVLALILSRGIMRVSGATLILEIIILIVVLSVLWVYIGSIINPVIQGWTEMCVV